MKELTLQTKYDPVGDLYTAFCPEQGQEHIGKSPDEAIGHLFREMWLGGAFDEWVKLNIKYDHGD